MPGDRDIRVHGLLRACHDSLDYAVENGHEDVVAYLRAQMDL
jgi:hypothetical protein